MMMLSKKTVLDKLVTIVNAIDTKLPSTSRLLLKENEIWTKKIFKNWLTKNTQYKKTENKIPSIIDLATTAALNTNAGEIENKMLDITNLATKTAFNTKSIETEREILDVINLATKDAVSTKATETENKIRDAIIRDCYSWI